MQVRYQKRLLQVVLPCKHFVHWHIVSGASAQKRTCDLNKQRPKAFSWVDSMTVPKPQQADLYRLSWQSFANVLAGSQNPWPESLLDYAENAHMKLAVRKCCLLREFVEVVISTESPCEACQEQRVSGVRGCPLSKCSPLPFMR